MESGAEKEGQGFPILHRWGPGPRLEPLTRPLPRATLGDLESIAHGDAAMTGRATKYSGERYAVVVQFSRSRGRYERQGILVTEAALRQAEEECAADAPERARLRERAADARVKG